MVPSTAFKSWLRNASLTASVVSGLRNGLRPGSHSGVCVERLAIRLIAFGAKAAIPDSIAFLPLHTWADKISDVRSPSALGAWQGEQINGADSQARKIVYVAEQRS
jgi:hypothetical protein